MNQMNPVLTAIDAQAKQLLQPLVGRIDREGLYPREYLLQLGALGGFAAIAPENTATRGLFEQIDIIRRVGEECGATAFSVWCQAACGWYLRQSTRSAVREKYAADVWSGKRLAGTGLSNTMKHLSGMEAHKLKAVKNGRGYVVNGSLPWVSNIGADHVWAVAAQTENGMVMLMVDGKRAGVQLKNCPTFCALEGTATLSVRLKDVHIGEDDILADSTQFADYIHAIKPGFILLQIGIGAGVIAGCLNIMRESKNVANPFLPDSAAEIAAEYERLLTQTRLLAQQVQNSGSLNLLSILQCRLDAAYLTLRAAQSAALHAGAKGYLLNHAAQRRSREAMFVAIVTPAIKHLHRDIAQLQAQAQAVA